MKEQDTITAVFDRMYSFSEFWDELSKWSQKTFGEDSVRGSEGPLKHLAKEVQECLENPKDLEEYADLVHLVFDACRRAGFSFVDLQYACTKKLKKNQARKWGAEMGRSFQQSAR